MKRLAVMAIVFAIIILSLISCSENPKEKIIGRWITSPDNEIKDAPINIVKSDTAMIFGQTFSIEYKDVEKGIQKGKINGPMGMTVDFEYDIKNDIFSIIFMGGKSDYIRFEGTDAEWDSLNALIMRQQQEGFVRMNMFAIDNIVKKYYSENNKYPSNVKYIIKELEGKIQNPLNPTGEFVISGYKYPEFDNEKIGCVYLRMYKGNKKYDIYGFGFDSILNMPKIESEITPELEK